MASHEKHKLGRYFREFDETTGDFIIPSKAYGEEMTPVVDSNMRADLICMRIMIRKKALPLSDEQKWLVRAGRKRRGSFGQPPPPPPGEPRVLRSNSLERGLREQPEVTMFDQMREYLHDETEITPGHYKPTGDHDLLQRDRLRFDPNILALLHVLWSAADTDASNNLSFDEYRAFHRLLFRCLRTRWDLETAERSAKADFETDRRGKDYVDKYRFYMSIFQAADLWTENVNEYEYRQLLKCVLKSIVYDGVTYKGRHFFRPITEVEPGCAVRMFRDKMKRRKFHAARAKQLEFLRKKAMGVIRASAPLANSLDVRCYLETRVNKMTSLELIDLGYHVEPDQLQDWMTKHGFDLEAVGPINAGDKMQTPEEAVKMVEARAANLWRKGVAGAKKLEAETITKAEKRAAVVRLLGAQALPVPLDVAPPAGGRGRRRGSVASSVNVDPAAFYDHRAREVAGPRANMQLAARAGEYDTAAMPKGFHVKVIQSLKGMREELERRGAAKAQQAQALQEVEEAIEEEERETGAPPVVTSKSMRRVQMALLGEDGAGSGSSSSSEGEGEGEAGGALEDTVDSVPPGAPEEYPDLEALERQAGGAAAAAEAAEKAERALIRVIIRGRSSRRLRRAPSLDVGADEGEAAPTPEAGLAPALPASPSFPQASRTPPAPPSPASPASPPASALLVPKKPVPSSFLNQLLSPLPPRPSTSGGQRRASVQGPLPALGASLDSALPAIPGRKSAAPALPTAASTPARPSSAGVARHINGPPQRRRVSLATGLEPVPPPADPAAIGLAGAAVRPSSPAPPSASPRSRRIPAPIVPPPPGGSGPALLSPHPPDEESRPRTVSPRRPLSQGVAGRPQPIAPRRPSASASPRRAPEPSPPAGPRPGGRRPSTAAVTAAPATPQAIRVTVPEPHAGSPADSGPPSPPQSASPPVPAPPPPRATREERRASVTAALARMEAASRAFEGAVSDVRSAQPVLVPLAPLFPFAPRPDDEGAPPAPSDEPPREGAAGETPEAPGAPAGVPRAASRASRPGSAPRSSSAASTAVPGAEGGLHEDGSWWSLLPPGAPPQPLPPGPEPPAAPEAARTPEPEGRAEGAAEAGGEGEGLEREREAMLEAAKAALEEEDEEEHRALHDFRGHDLLSAIG